MTNYEGKTLISPLVINVIKKNLMF